MRLTIGTATDTYEPAIAAVQAAYRLRPGVPAAWPHAPADPRPGPQDVADDNLADGWAFALAGIRPDLLRGEPSGPAA
ncbi:hypothetical protein [Streptomyces sp. 900105755]